MSAESIPVLGGMISEPAAFFWIYFFQNIINFFNFCFWNLKSLIFYVITFNWCYPWMVLVLLDYWFYINILLIWRETCPWVEYLTRVRSQQNGEFHNTKTNRIYENSSHPGEISLRWNDFSQCKQFFPPCPTHAGLLFSLSSVCFYNCFLKKYNSSYRIKQYRCCS